MRALKGGPQGRYKAYTPASATQIAPQPQKNCLSAASPRYSGLDTLYIRRGCVQRPGANRNQRNRQHMLEALSSQMSQAHGGTDVLGLAGRRLQWLQNRESVLAGNVANANTPGYVPKDTASFQGVLQNQMAMTLAQTEPGHLAARNSSGSATRTGTNTSLDGNQVNIEGELEKIADTNDQQRLATNAYTVYTSMFSIALGSSSS